MKQYLDLEGLTQILQSVDQKKADATDISSKADSVSPVFTGTPTAPTASPGTKSTQIATTEFVNDAIEDATCDSTSISKDTINDLLTAAGYPPIA